MLSVCKVTFPGSYESNRPPAALHPTALSLLCSCIVVLLVANPLPAFAEQTEKPNVIVIVADDQGWNDIGYNGSEVLTPHLDDLAQNGVRLEANYAFPTCSPMRIALLAGRNPSRYGVLGPIGGRSKQALPPETATMADLFGSAGYRTAISGKWHLGLRPEVGPLQYGFASTYGYLHGQLDQYTHHYKNGDRTWHRQDRFLDEEGHATDLIAAEAIRVIEAASDPPFFLYVPFSVPHYPLQEPDEWVSLYDGRIDDEDRKLFAASLTHMDDAVGRIVAALERSGKRKSTLIIFTSDNGGQQSWSSQNQYGGRHGPNKVLGNNRPLRGWKGDVYEGGIRVPALVNWPGTLQPATVTEPISVLDWYPTLAALIGVEVDSAWQLEGINLWPGLRDGVAGEKSRQLSSRTLYWQTGRNAAVRQGSWKLVAHQGERPRYELYDVASDPYEKTDRAGTATEKLAALKIELSRQQQLDNREAARQR